MKTSSVRLFEPALVQTALKQSFIKLDPRIMIKNPVMFTVEIGTLIMAYVTVYSINHGGQGNPVYNFILFLILLLTVLFANFAEAIAEARGKAQADSLRKTREETPAKVLLPDGSIEVRSSSYLEKGDIFICEAGDTIPTDGEIVEGIATIDESAITGESAPVIRESGGDKSSVTGGTKVLSDQIKVKVNTRPGESFLDKMIALVEGASRQKTPNEVALTIRIGQLYIGLYYCLRHVKTVCRLRQYTRHRCGTDLAVCLSDPNDHRRTAFRNRHCRNGPGITRQRDHKVWKGGRDCR